MFKLLVPVVLVFLFVASSHGQVKYEREYRIKEGEAPQPAKEFIDSLEVDGKIKWYREVNIEAESVEAKFMLDKKKHSVEFDTAGNLQDVEVNTEWNELIKEVRDSITSHFKQFFLRYKIDKIQTQYTGPPSQIIRLLRGAGSGKDITIHFELVVRGNKDHQMKSYEFTFNHDGKMVTYVEIVDINTDNLEY